MTKKILLADDSVTIRKVVELTFMEEDYELQATADGREAMTHLESAAPDLVIADVHMPEADGFEVARESKRLHPDVPVLLLVGTFEPFDPDEVEASGANAFLKKPFDSQDLLRKVKRLLADSDGDEPGGEPAAAVAASESAVTQVPLAAEHEGGEEGPEAEPDDEVETEEDEADASAIGLSEADVERIARRVAEILSPDALREVAWEVIPDTAEIVIKERLRELESQVD